MAWVPNSEHVKNWLSKSNLDSPSKGLMFSTYFPLVTSPFSVTCFLSIFLGSQVWYPTLVLAVILGLSGQKTSSELVLERFIA